MARCSPLRGHTRRSHRRAGPLAADTQALRSVANLAAAQPAGFGVQQRNPAYREPVPPEKPWTDRHMYLMYGVLILAVLAMGTVAVRFLLKVSPAGK